MSANKASRDPLVVFCRECGRRLLVPAAAAGRRGKCALCGALFRIPVESESGPPASPADGSSTPQGGVAGEQAVPPTMAGKRNLLIAGGVGAGLVLLSVVGVLGYAVFFRNPPADKPAPKEMVYAKRVLYCMPSPGRHSGVLKKGINRNLIGPLTRAARQLGLISDPRVVASPAPEYLLFKENTYVAVDRGPPRPVALTLGESLGAHMDRAADSLLGQRVTVTISSDGKVRHIDKAD